MRAAHGCGNVEFAQHTLARADVVACSQQVGGKHMALGVQRRDTFPTRLSAVAR